MDMSYMFYYCGNLTALNLRSFNTSNVTDMRGMFQECRGLTSLDMSKFDTSKVTDMSSMFSGCWRLTMLDLSKFDTSNVTDITEMFDHCSDLTAIYASEKFVTTNVSNGSEVFYYCIKLVGGAGTKFDSSYTDATYACIDNGADNPGYFTYKLILGDVNRNGVIDQTDLIWLSEAAAEMRALTYNQSQAADINGDGQLNSTDILMLARYLEGLDELPILDK